MRPSWHKPIPALLYALSCVLALALFAQVGGIARFVTIVAGGSAIDFCASGCEDQDDSTPCSPVCNTCSCAPLMRTIAHPLPDALAVHMLYSNSSPITGRLLAAPKHVVGDGVFHPPRV